MNHAQRLIGTDRAVKAYQLAARGITHRQIAEELGISQSAATRAVERGQKLALADFKHETAGQITEQLARLQAGYQMALESFAASKTPAARKRSTHSDRDGNTTRTASVDMVEHTPGDPRFLTEARKNVERICRLLSLDAPRRIQIDVPQDRPHEDSSEEQIKEELAVLFKQAGLNPADFK